jgi:phosphoribosylaminoimidazole-succinocarboxamide synthase
MRPDNQAIFETDLKGAPLWRRGKVRDVYDLGDHLLIVATDRLSAFDVVLPTPIPGKGRVLTQLSLFWFSLLRSMVPNHVRSSEVASYPERLRDQADQLDGRSMMVLKTEPLPVECVVRGYITGSGWKDYKKSGAVCGIALPAGLRESDRLPEPIFTPTTKAETGHDESMSFGQVVDVLGEARAVEVRDLSLALYREAAAHAEQRGIILADTKFEFGLHDGRLVWIDEALTPDSSRFWPRDQYRPGQGQPSFDKQYVRDYLETLDWNKQPPAPSLPPEVVERTRAKYEESLARLTDGASAGAAWPDRAASTKRDR